MNQDNFKDCAKRHLDDAYMLFRNKQFDNAIHLAGFSAECSLKAVITHYILLNKYNNINLFIHDIELLAKNMQQFSPIDILIPQLGRLKLHMAIRASKLPIGHPERRYWSSGLWSELDVKEAIMVAKKIYQNTIISLNL